jgi:hypothetical protein
MPHAKRGGAPVPAGGRRTKRPIRDERKRHHGVVIMRARKYLVLGILGMAVAAAPAAAHGGWGGGWHGGWHGGWGGGWGVGIGIAPFYAAPYYPPYYPPPAYYAPPAYYPPPAGYYSPYPGYIARDPSAGTNAQSCNAGSYVCPMEVPVPAGARCYCRGNNGQRVYGSAQ